MYSTLVTFAQDFTQFKQAIDQYKSCRLATFTNSGCAMIVIGGNGFWMKGCPQAMNDQMNQIAAAGQTIVDVQVTEKQSWAVLYGANGYSTNGVPTSLNNKLKELNSGGQIFRSIAINDIGEWVVVTNTNIYFSDTDLQSAIVEDMGAYGNVVSVCLTDDAMLVVYDGGYGAYGEIPTTLSNSLGSLPFNPTDIAIAGTRWVAADNNGSYSYNM